MRVGSLCSGYGGLELALDLMGVDHELAWVSEVEPDASAVLAERFPTAPNIGDLTTADPDPVDIVTAGFPCQPLSTAGHRKGLNDERWIWDAIEALIGRMEPRPQLLLFENVPGLLTANGGNAMARVIQGLAGLGFMGAYRLIRASDIGACHQRRRWFCAAWPTDAASLGWSARSLTQAIGGDTSRHLPTPQAWDGGRGPDYNRPNRPNSGGDDLSTAAALLATPKARDFKDAGLPPYLDDAPRASLPQDITRLPTPTAADHIEARTTHARGNPTLQGTVGGVREVEAERHLKAGRHLPTPTSALGLGGNHTRGDDRSDERLLGGIAKSLPTPTAADAIGSRRATARRDYWTSHPGTTITDIAYADQWGEFAEAIATHERVIGRPPPPPTTPGPVNAILNPAFVEWMQMIPDGWVTELDISRSAKLRILGNGVVPLQAATAYLQLIEEREASP